MNLKIFFTLFIFLGGLTGCNGSSSQKSEPRTSQDVDVDPFLYKIVARDPRWPDRNFTIKIYADDELARSEFERRLVNNKIPLNSDGNPIIGIPNAELVRTTPTAEHNWSYAFEIKTLVFGDVASEVCDASFGHIEDHYDEWIQYVSNYCPWGFPYYIKEIWIETEQIFSRP